MERSEEVIEIISETPEWAPSWIVHIEKKLKTLEVQNEVLREALDCAVDGLNRLEGMCPYGCECSPEDFSDHPDKDFCVSCRIKGTLTKIKTIQAKAKSLESEGEEA